MTRPSDRRTPCGCGCGQPVARRYAPGHDARHKSALASTVLAGGIAATRAADLLADLGWAGFADAAALRATPMRTPRGRVLQRASEVAVWQVDHLGVHHAHRACSRLTRTARLVGGTNPITRLASDRYVTLVATGPHLVAHLLTSWDQCTECSTDDTTRDEDAERVTCYKQAIWEGDPREIPARAPTSWVVLADEIAADEDHPRVILQCGRNPLTGRITRRWPAPTNTDTQAA